VKRGVIACSRFPDLAANDVPEVDATGPVLAFLPPNPTAAYYLIVANVAAQAIVPGRAFSICPISRDGTLETTA